jgi:DNA ligase-1
VFISPMLLETAPAPFSHADYVFEPKIDGHRLILSHINGETRLYTRHNNDCTRRYPELIANFGYDIILDGEIACTDPETGEICLESVMTRLSSIRTEKVRRLSMEIPANFVVFDVLQLNGIDLRGLPLMKRKEILAELTFPSGIPITKIPYTECEGSALFQQICALKMEGMVAKQRESRYISNRSDAWLKIINWTYVDVYISGYRKGALGWLASVMESDGTMRPVGVIELGIKPLHKKAFNGVMLPLVCGEDREYVYLEPRLKAKVKIRNWTKAGLLRSPAFVDFIL